MNQLFPVVCVFPNKRRGEAGGRVSTAEGLPGLRAPRCTT
jgi:hypothetical protein